MTHPEHPSDDSRSVAPVFSDPSGKRWRTLRGAALGFGVFSTLLALVLALAVLVPPLLPSTWQPAIVAKPRLQRLFDRKLDRARVEARRRLLTAL